MALPLSVIGALVALMVLRLFRGTPKARLPVGLSRGAAEAVQRWVSASRAHCSLEGLKQGGAMWWRKEAHRPERQALRCSFCNKLQDEVEKLIAGPRVFICDECVEVCNDIIADDERFERQAGKTVSQRTGDSPMPWPNMIHCALCRMAIPATDGFVVENRGILCAGCVSAVQAARVNGQ